MANARRVRFLASEMTTTPKYGTGRTRLLTAAREVFAESGYRGSTTRDIALRAGISEPMLFRHFGSKAALFERAALDPVIGFIDEYLAEWAERPHGQRDPELEVRDFLSRVVVVLATDRDLLVAILAAEQFDPELASAARQLEHAFGRVLGVFEQMLDEEIAVRGYHSRDRPALARLFLALALSMALHDNWLHVGNGSTRVSADRMLAEAARVIVFGVSGDASLS